MTTREDIEQMVDSLNRSAEVLKEVSAFDNPDRLDVESIKDHVKNLSESVRIIRETCSWFESAENRVSELSDKPKENYKELAGMRWESWHLLKRGRLSPDIMYVRSFASKIEDIISTVEAERKRPKKKRIKKSVASDDDVRERLREKGMSESDIIDILG